MSIEVEVGGIYEEAADLTPAGAVIAFAGVNAPSGWLLCDGSAVNRVTYSRLFDAIGINFGQGDGSTTFNLPDLQGYFIRGRDNGTGNDPDVSTRTASAAGGNTGDAVGSKQEDAIRNITGSFDVGYAYVADGTGVFSGLNGQGFYPSSSMTSHANNKVNFNASSDVTIKTASDNRPKNIAMNYIIKI